MQVFRHEYEAWVRLCDWLEDQPYNASYAPKVEPWLVADPRQWTKQLYGAQTFARAKRASGMRKAYNLIYWATGFGWRLRKDYRAELERMQARIIKDHM